MAGASPIEKGGDDFEERFHKEATGGKKGARDAKMKELLKRRAKKEGFLQQRIHEYEERMDASGANETARSEFSMAGSTASKRRFYSMEKLKAAVQKSMGTGLFKKKGAGDATSRSYLYKDAEGRSPPLLRSPEQKRPAAAIRKSVDIGRKKYQRGSSAKRGGN